MSERDDTYKVSGNFSGPVVFGTGEAKQFNYGARNSQEMEQAEGLLRQLKDGLAELDPESAALARRGLADVEEELRAPRPDRNRIDRLLSTLQRIIEPLGGLVSLAETLRQLLAGILH